MTQQRDPDYASSTFKAAPHGHWALLLGDQCFAKDPPRAKSEAGSKPPWLPAPLRALSPNMLDVDEPDHRRLRTLVQKAFTPRVVEELRPRIEDIAHELLDRIEQRGTGTPDLIADYAAPIPVTVIAELLGVEHADRRRVHRWSTDVVAADSSTWHKLRAIPSGIAFILFLRKLIRKRRAAPREDLLSGLVAAQDAGDRLTACGRADRHPDATGALWFDRTETGCGVAVAARARAHRRRVIAGTPRHIAD